MANKAPFFPTGGNVKIRVNGVTLAYATDFRYTVRVNHQDARILGVYEHDTAEVLSYDVNGSFTLIRYIEGVKDRLEAAGAVAPNGASNLGNGVGSWTANQPNGLAGVIRNSGNLTNDGRANEALDPSRYHTGTWFDIELYQKVVGGRQTGIAKLRNCRITQVDTEISKRGIMTQSFQFISNGVDEDSFLANPSGVGQQQA
jgi:hypothetical protein